MPQMNLTLDITDERLATMLLKASGFSGVKIVKAELVSEVKAAAPAPTQPEPALNRPLKIENPERYINQPGISSTTGGRPRRLTDDGVQLVYTYFKLGYSFREIGEAFGGLLTGETVRRTVRSVQAFKKP